MPAILSANAGARPTTGAHICGVFGSQEERCELLADFVRRGLERGDRLLFVSDDPHLRKLLAAEHLVCDDAFSQGRAAVMPSTELYLRDGVFLPERVVARLAEAGREAAAAGFAGLRVVADMSWAERERDRAALAAYERRAGTVFSDGTVMAVCLYGTSTFGADVLEGIRRAHPLLGGTSRPAGGDGGAWAVGDRGTLRLGGEIDFANASHLGALLRAQASPHGDLVIDLSELDFIDIAGLRALTSAARQTAGDRHVVVRAAPTSTRKVLRLLGWDRAPFLSLQAEDGGGA